MPETTDYLILGLVMTGILIGVFIASLAIRRRNLEQDLEMIERLKDE